VSDLERDRLHGQVDDRIHRHMEEEVLRSAVRTRPDEMEGRVDADDDLACRRPRLQDDGLERSDCRKVAVPLTFSCVTNAPFVDGSAARNPVVRAVAAV
jgi:hypothetical protein